MWFKWLTVWTVLLGNTNTSAIFNKPSDRLYCYLLGCPDDVLNNCELHKLFLFHFKNFGGAYSRRLVRPSVSPSVRQSVRTSHSCPAHNFIIWSRISKLFYRNDHHVQTTCRAQNLGPYLEGQGHSATLQQNRVRLITLLFEVGFP